MSLTPSTFYAFWMYGRRRSKVTFTTQSFELHHQCNNNKHTVIMKLLLFRHLGIKSTWLVFGRDHGWRNISQLMSRRPKWHKLSNIHKCDVFKFDCIWPNFLATYTMPSDVYFMTFAAWNDTRDITWKTIQRSAPFSTIRLGCSSVKFPK